MHSVLKAFTTPVTTSFNVLCNRKKHFNCLCNLKAIKWHGACESLRLPEAGYHVSPNSPTLSPALCVGYATFADRDPVSPHLVYVSSTTSRSLCS